MAISRIKPSDWALNEELTSVQMNAVDTNVTFALDKRVGETDTVASDVTFEGDIDVTTSIVIFYSGSHLTLRPGTITSFACDIALSGVSTYNGFSSINSTGIVNLGGTNIINGVNTISGTTQILGTVTLERTPKPPKIPSTIPPNLSGVPRVGSVAL